MEERILGAIEWLKRIVERNDTKLSVSMARTNDDLSKLQAVDRDFDVRLRVVETRG
jgi:hypothetical protein